MSAHYGSAGVFVPLAVLTASLLGSGHCVAMCGGLVVATARTRSAWMAYHVARLGGYLVLGAVAGLLGEALLGRGQSGAWAFELTSWLAASLVAFSLVLVGVRVWQGRAIHVPLIPQSLLSWLYRKAGHRAWIVGGLSAFLPCGWLHSFVLGAAATQSAVLGAGFLLIFWLGTLPALGFAPILTERFLKPIAHRSPKGAAVLLVIAGLASVGVKVVPLVRPHTPLENTSTVPEESCH